MSGLEVREKELEAYILMGEIELQDERSAHRARVKELKKDIRMNKSRLRDLRRCRK